MSSPVTSRRAFVAAALALVLAPARATYGARVAPHDCGRAGGHGARRRGPHPVPRQGITAAKVAPAARLVDEPAAVRAAFDEVRRVPQVVDGIRCQCGCAEQDGHYSLLSCFEGAGMARHCEICRGQGRMAFRLHQAGKSLDEIRAAIDDRYGE
jgi:hypothetical protein